jgi:PEGA domain-containing protein
MRAALAIMLAMAAPAMAAPKKKPDPQTAEQKEADRHFKAGVALFKESKFAEALAEFERANELAPHPLVLYNIAACHRELSNYQDAVKFYNRFLKEGAGKVAPARLHTAQTELDGIMARIASVTVVVADGTEVFLDGKSLGAMPIDMPLIVPPGEHVFSAKATGHKDAERKLRVASGDEVSIQLDLPELPKETPKETPGGVTGTTTTTGMIVRDKPKQFRIGAGFGTNLRAVGDTGAPSLGVGLAIGTRVEMSVDAILVAYAVMPSLRIRLAGEGVSVHLIGAVPIAFPSGAMSTTFAAGAAGLGLRFRATPSLAFRLESLASFAGKDHGTTFPAFVGGELWF